MDKDYVKQAEEVIIRLQKADSHNRIKLTTSQIRQILSLANQINNKILETELKYENTNTLTKEITNLIKSMEVKLVYQAGRDQEVKNFMEKSKLREELQKIGTSKEKFKEFFAYLEALVAYHRFYGGKE